MGLSSLSLMRLNSFMLTFSHCLESKLNNSRCYLEAGALTDAQALLEKSLKMNKTVLGANDISNAGIITTLSKVYMQKKEYENSIQNLEQVWELTEKKFGKDSIEIALVYQDFAKIYSKKWDLDESIKY